MCTKQLKLEQRNRKSGIIFPLYNQTFIAMFMAVWSIGIYWRVHLRELFIKREWTVVICILHAYTNQPQSVFLCVPLLVPKERK